MPRKRPLLTGQQAKEIRLQLQMNQLEFWGRLNVKQSTGSRYEGGSRPLPPAVEQLLRMATGSEKEALEALMAMRAGFGKQSAPTAPAPRSRRKPRESEYERAPFAHLPFGMLP